jgi:L-ascorbate metabolism protein UlaG (beta-lactamase superfamily)
VKDVRLTHIGGRTLLIEAAGWRLLTDPTFDPPGERYSFGWGSEALQGGHGGHRTRACARATYIRQRFRWLLIGIAE